MSAATRKAAAGTLPVHLPRNIVLFLEDLCAAAGVEGGAAGWISHHFASMIREEPASFCSGVVEALLRDYEVTDPVSDQIIGAAVGWKPDGKEIVTRDQTGGAGFQKPKQPARPRSQRLLMIDLPEELRPVLKRLIRLTGFYGSPAELMGHIVGNDDVFLDWAARALQSATDIRAGEVSRLWGEVALEKILIHSKDSISARSTMEWVFGAADEEAAAS